MEQSGSPSIDDVLDTLRARVEERRRQGLYPEGLEDDLDLHFRHIAMRAVRDRLARLEVALAAADAQGSELRAERIGVGSDRPGGTAVHKAVAKLVSRQIEGALTQVREYAEALAEAHRAELLAISDLVSQVDDLRDRFAAATTLPDDAQRAVGDLERRLAALEEDAARRAPRVWPDPGDVPESPERWESIRTHVKPEGRVLVAGPGGLAEYLEEAGAQVTFAGDDLTGRLRAGDPGTYATVVMTSAFERRAPEEQFELVAVLAERLAAGARVVVEVRNPHTLLGPMPDAVAPSHPAYVSFLFSEAGFDTGIHWHEGGAGAGEEQAKAQVRRLAEAVFGFRMFTLVATKR